MLGIFIASLGLSTAVAGTALLAPAGTAEGHAIQAAPRLRFWTLLMALFGLIGIPLTLLNLAAPVPITVAVLAAAVLARMLGLFFGETSADIGLTHLVGSEGRVLLPVDATAGKVVVETLAERVELPARTPGGSPIHRGHRVLVAGIHDGVAAVVPLDLV